MKKPKKKSKTTAAAKKEKKVKAPAEPVFTPPTKPGDLPVDPEVDKDVVGDGEEFEVVKVEEMPAQPHPHGRSNPMDGGADNDSDKVDGKKDKEGPDAPADQVVS
jgi:hypothetical protein